ncbi:type IV conjugative transfer system protein TraV (plasmid) [Persephonella marina EX-H1]|uniref:Type IV conjugative transfer system protein TraV n=1 Tax=Persephonella marina (strain DSM 14350 / EX-H1) TaxID=123214 RepID=C0QUW7_PERMH|nr:type IV conjugative transfer system lipoprotein TraV [Persephonella marina]ACO04991.1 type IV conjugative transfer system protein TraV [Persephonella marina EX-H1]
MKRHVLALIFVVPFLTGCSSILGIGHENFRCEGTDKGGVCAPVDKVYKDRHLLGNQKDTVIDREKEKEISEEKEEGVFYEGCYGEVKISKDGKPKCNLKPKAEIKVRVIKEKPFAQPIRIQPKIAKIWIQPYVDENGNLVDGRYIYVIVKKGGWLLPDGTKIYDDEVKDDN